MMSNQPTPLEYKSVNKLPVEIVRYIIRLATAVPEAFDTSPESVLHEDRLATRGRIRDSLKTKWALSLVSKSFRVLGNEFLFEFLLFTESCGLLQSSSRQLPLDQVQAHHSRTLGSRVRRLEVDIHSTQVFWSWDDLTKLVVGCPNLEILIIRLHKASEERSLSHDHNHDECLRDPTPRSGKDRFNCWERFFRNTCRSDCHRTLRKIELGRSVALSRGLLAPILASLPALEVFYAGSLAKPVGSVAPGKERGWMG